MSKITIYTKEGHPLLIATLVKGKKGQALINEWYNYPNHTTLYDAYNNPSYSKQRAYESCVNWAIRCGTGASKVTGHNSSYFSFMWEYVDPCTHIKYLIKETSINRYATRIG